MKNLKSLAISQWNLCLAAVWTVIQILQIICKVVNKCPNLYMGRNDIWFLWSLRDIYGTHWRIRKVYKFSDSDCLISIFGRAKQFPTFGHAKQLAWRAQHCQLQSVAAWVLLSFHQISLSTPTTVSLLQKMGRKMTLAKVAQHVNDFGMKPVKGKLKESDFHSSGKCHGSIQLWWKIGKF